MLSSLLAQQGSSPPQDIFGALLLPFVLVIGIFYFLVIRPMRKRQSSLEELISGLKNGDKVITGGGIYGTIAGIRDKTFVLKVADQMKMEISKNAVASLQPPEDNPS